MRHLSKAQPLAAHQVLNLGLESANDRTAAYRCTAAHHNTVAEEQCSAEEYYPPQSSLFAGAFVLPLHKALSAFSLSLTPCVPIRPYDLCLRIITSPCHRSNQMSDATKPTEPVCSPTTHCTLPLTDATTVLGRTKAPYLELNRLAPRLTVLADASHDLAGFAPKTLRHELNDVARQLSLLAEDFSTASTSTHDGPWNDLGKADDVLQLDGIPNHGSAVTGGKEEPAAAAAAGLRAAQRQRQEEWWAGVEMIATPLEVRVAGLSGRRVSSSRSLDAERSRDPLPFLEGERRRPGGEAFGSVEECAVTCQGHMY